MSVAKKDYKRITTKSLIEMKANGEKISMLTAYDYTMAKIVDTAGIDVILVGDSASNVMAGHETTLPITLDQMIYHASSVVRAVERALVVVDLPFETAWHKLPSDVRDASTNAQGQIDDIEIRNVLGNVSAPILSDDDFIAMEFGLTI
mgnify:CR=1 FL=1